MKLKKLDLHNELVVVTVSILILSSLSIVITDTPENLVGFATGPPGSPEVDVISPINETRFTEDANWPVDNPTHFHCAASDPDGVKRIDWYLEKDGIEIYHYNFYSDDKNSMFHPSNPHPPAWQTNFDLRVEVNLPEGNYYTYCKATDGGDLTSTSDPVTFTIDPPSLLGQDQDLVYPTDLIYLGAFRYPSGQGGTPSYREFSPNDPSPGDGFPGSLFVGGATNTGEIDIPVPVNDPNPNNWPVAQTIQNPRDITGGLISDFADWLWPPPTWQSPGYSGRGYQGPAGGYTGEQLYFNFRDTYVHGAPNPEDAYSFGWADVDLNAPNPQGLWHVGPYVNNKGHEFNFAKTSGPFVNIDPVWADTYINGMYLGSGYHRESGTHGSQQGPSLYASAPWNEPGGVPGYHTDVPAVALIWYPTDDYHCNWWNNYPDFCYYPNYHTMDDYNGGVWVKSNTGGKSALIFSSDKKIGMGWYGSDDTPPAGQWHAWYSDTCGQSGKGFNDLLSQGELIFYDPNDLAAVVNGTKNPWEVIPYAIWDFRNQIPNYVPGVNTCSGAGVGGMAYDRNNDLIYLQSNGGIHVFQIQPQDCDFDWQCDDSNACNGDETCNTAQRVCVPGTPIPTDDFVSCTVDSCNPSNGQVSHTENHAFCDDGNVCTVNTCDPDNDCQTAFAAIDVICDDGYACTIGDTCDGAGSCGNGVESNTECENIYQLCSAVTCDISLYSANPFGCGDFNPGGCEVPPNLVAHWMFDETSGTTASDSSVNSNDGNLFNNPTFVPSQIGNALSFDNTDDYMFVSDSDSLDVSDGITITGWFYFNDVRERNMLSKWDPNVGVSFAFATGYSNNDEFYLAIDDDGNPASGGHSITSSAANLQANTWYHLAATMDATTRQLYIDGNPITFSTSGSFPSSIFASTSDVWVGQFVGAGNAKPFNGLIDDLRIYNIALTPAEILTLATISGGPVCGNSNCEAGEDVNNCPQDCNICGDGVMYGTEECDSPDYGTYGNGIDECSVINSSYVAGNLSCNPSACVIEFDNCLLPLPSCGDGVIDTGEQCDDFNTANGDGCNAACQVETDYICTNEPSICILTVVCGDGVVNGTEVCELNTTRSCDTGDPYLEEETCLSDCTNWGQCLPIQNCGDGIINGNEQCDIPDLNNQTCVGLNYTGGNLSCNNVTCMFDISQCFPQAPSICGNNIVETGEDCDGNTTTTCSDLNLTFGTVTCSNCSFNTTQCTQVACNDGQCHDLYGESCSTCPEDCGGCPPPPSGSPMIFKGSPLVMKGSPTIFKGDTGGLCGNGYCNDKYDGETCENCPEDCGQCLRTLTDTEDEDTFDVELSPNPLEEVNLNSFFNNRIQGRELSQPEVEFFLGFTNWLTIFIICLLFLGLILMQHSKGFTNILHKLKMPYKHEKTIIKKTDKHAHKQLKAMETFVSQAKESGFTKTEIELQLKRAGWQHDIIEQKLK